MRNSLKFKKEILKYILWYSNVRKYYTIISKGKCQGSERLTWVKFSGFRLYALYDPFVYACVCVHASFFVWSSSYTQCIKTVQTYMTNSNNFLCLYCLCYNSIKLLEVESCPETCSCYLCDCRLNVRTWGEQEKEKGLSWTMDNMANITVRLLNEHLNISQGTALL